MNRYYISLYAVITVMLIACQSEPTITERGFPFEFIIDEPGETAEVGEYVYFDLTMRNGDSTLHSTFTSPEKPRIAIPNEESINANTPPVIDALKLMSIGDSLTLHFPLDCLKVRPPQFEDVEVISYDIVMRDIKSAEAYQAEADSLQAIAEEKRLGDLARKDDIIEVANQSLRDYKSNNLDLTTLDSGLSYVIHEEGTGTQPARGDQVSVHYYGMYEDGNSFDTSFDDGIPYTFQLGLGRVIQGWDIGIAEFKEGTKATLFVPYTLAYGEAGFQGIPGKTDLVFYVELDKVN